MSAFIIYQGNDIETEGKGDLAAGFIIITFGLKLKKKPENKNTSKNNRTLYTKVRLFFTENITEQTEKNYMVLGNLKWKI